MRFYQNRNRENRKTTTALEKRFAQIIHETSKPLKMVQEEKEPVSWKLGYLFIEPFKVFTYRSIKFV